MAIRIQCEKCKKKISIDEAFAGGVCRCPYCKTLVLVKDASKPKAHKGRPEGPAARPEAPGQQSEETLKRELAEHAEAVPEASPVRVQGILTLVMIGLILVMVLGGIAMALMLIRDQSESEPAGSEPVNPFGKTESAQVAGMNIEPPVVYVLDAGSSMSQVFDYAAAMTQVSVRSLQKNQTFNVLLVDSSEQGYTWILESMSAGGKTAEREVSESLEVVNRLGATDIASAIEAAVQKDPKTIVLFAKKPVYEEAFDAAKKAQERGVKILTIALDREGMIVESLAKLANITDGESKSYTFGMLQDWVGRAELPD